MILCELSCVDFITTLYDSMEANNWLGFDKWMCFICGKEFTLDKYVGYDRNTLQLVFSDCPHPACSVCKSCFDFFQGAVMATDFQEFNLLRVGYQLISFTQDVLNTIANVSDKKCNKCFLFNLLVCFERAKIFRHIADIGGALMNISIGTYCTVQGLFDSVGEWSRDDFISMAEALDGADSISEVVRILIKIYSAFN